MSDSAKIWICSMCIGTMDETSIGTECRQCGYKDKAAQKISRDGKTYHCFDGPVDNEWPIDRSCDG